MFVQYSTASSREKLTPKNWYWARVGDLADRTRVGVYWPSDNLFFPGFIERRLMEHEHEIGVRYDDPEVAQVEQIGPNEIILVYGCEDVLAEMAVEDIDLSATSSSTFADLGFPTLSLIPNTLSNTEVERAKERILVSLVRTPPGPRKSTEESVFIYCTRSCNNVVQNRRRKPGAPSWHCI